VSEVSEVVIVTLLMIADMEDICPSPRQAEPPPSFASFGHGTEFPAPVSNRLEPAL